MKFAIVFSSMTGNTAALADKLHEILPADDCVYFGDPAQYSPDLGADLVFVGFWTEKESCDGATRVFLKSLSNTNVVLFGTAGYVDDEYDKQILKNAESDILVSNTVLSGFICQGKMSQEAVARFSRLLENEPENETLKLLVGAYDQGLSHPDAHDFEAFEKWAKNFTH